MSEVTNLILSFSIGEDEDARIKEVNSFRYRGLEMNLVSADFNKDLESGRAWLRRDEVFRNSTLHRSFQSF